MKKNKKKLFIACDTSKISKVKKILKYTKNKQIKIGFKFGLEFLNSNKWKKFYKRIKK